MYSAHAKRYVKMILSKNCCRKTKKQQMAEKNTIAVNRALVLTEHREKRAILHEKEILLL